MGKKSAGILAYRFHDGVLQVLLVHPGGPFFTKKDAGVWSVPKGEFEDEEPLAAAKREFEEEVGMPISGTFTALTPVVQKSGKKVWAFAVRSDIDPTNFKSNTFPLEWPPRSGKFVDTPEVDKVEWLDIPTAMQKINTGQIPLLAELQSKVGIE